MDGWKVIVAQDIYRLKLNLFTMIRENANEYRFKQYWRAPL